MDYRMTAAHKFRTRLGYHFNQRKIDAVKSKKFI